MRQRQLEARNHLLELAATNKREGLPPFPSQQKTQVKQTHARLALTDKMQADLLKVSVAGAAQIEAREGSLKLLERSGLARKQQGSVLVLTVHDQEEDVLIQDISKMSPVHIAKLYSVSTLHLRHTVLEQQSLHRLAPYVYSSLYSCLHQRSATNDCEELSIWSLIPTRSCPLV